MSWSFIETFARFNVTLHVIVKGQRLTLLHYAKLTKDRVLGGFHSHQHFSRDPKEQLLSLKWTEIKITWSKNYIQKHQLLQCTIE